MKYTDAHTHTHIHTYTKTHTYIHKDTYIHTQIWNVQIIILIYLKYF